MKRFLADLSYRMGDLHLFRQIGCRFAACELVLRRAGYFENSAQHRDRPEIAVLIDEH